MLLTAEAWRLGGTLLGDAVACEQRRPLLAVSVAHRRVPAAATPPPRQPRSRAPQHGTELAGTASRCRWWLFLHSTMNRVGSYRCGTSFCTTKPELYPMWDG